MKKVPMEQTLNKLNKVVPILKLGQKRDISSFISSELRYRRLFESAKDGILILDPLTAKIVDANPFIVNLLGYSLEEIIGKQLWEIGVFRNKEESKKAFSQLKMNRYIRFDDMPLLRKNGQKVEVEFVSNVYEVSRIDVIQCNIRDITQRKLTERILRESEQLLSKTQKIAKLGSFKFNFDNEELTWSDEMFNIFGVSKEVFNPTISSFINYIHPNDRDSMAAWVRDTTLGENPGELEFRIVRPDKTIIDIFGSGILLIDQDGKPSNIIGSLQDITERKHSEKALKDSEAHLKEQNVEILTLNEGYQALNEELKSTLQRIQKMNTDLVAARDKAEESDRLKSAFLANISHEIRTPLNAIMGFSDLLIDPDLSKAKIEQYVQIINVNGNQLLTVISDIIDISKIVTGEMTLNTELVSIDGLLKEIFTTYSKQIRKNDLKLSYYSNPEYSDIDTITDLNRVKQVLCNLLNNAIKFTQKGEILFGFNLTGNNIEFFVKDTGIGIAPGDQDSVFERFRQVEETLSRKFGGSGLGLSISKALVEMLGGTISLKSELGKGSTFFFTIPLTFNLNSHDHSNIHLQINQTRQWADKTILIVEDEDSNHMYLDEVLSPTGVSLLHAWNGEKAIEMVKSNPGISLILMDIKMPLVNGFEATQKIKLSKPELPIIALTAYALNQDRTKALQAGFDNYLSKPVLKDALLELLDHYLNS
ncbi:MAG: PAS domain S-box protein [Bacteroidetes bacterium]|nr:PAS domain S-box protein [Bacteroidota bacterium]